MSGKRRKIGIAVWLCIVLILLAACILTAPSAGGEDSIKEVMRDAVLHENDKISLLGVIEVNPAVLSGLVVTGALLLLAAILRIWAIPNFKYVPGRLQMLLEQAVDLSSLRLQPSEVAEVAWATAEEILQMIREKRFVPLQEGYVRFVFGLRQGGILLPESEWPR